MGKIIRMFPNFINWKDFLEKTIAGHENEIKAVAMVAILKDGDSFTIWSPECREDNLKTLGAIEELKNRYWEMEMKNQDDPISLD